VVQVIIKWNGFRYEEWLCKREYKTEHSNFVVSGYISYMVSVQVVRKTGPMLASTTRSRTELFWKF